jgi:ComF family protein
MNGWLNALIDLVYPVAPAPDRLPRLEAPWCYRCGEPFYGETEASFTCSNCAGRGWHLETARACYRAEGHVREVIHDFKYSRRFFHLPRLGGWLCDGYDRFFAGADPGIRALVPVPLHASRQRQRGFNQAGELARFLGRHAGLPVWPALTRVRKTEVQARLRRSERLRNQRNAYELQTPFDVTGARLLIVDDVFTTGATVDACARVLCKAGAARVDALTVARG